MKMRCSGHGGLVCGREGDKDMVLHDDVLLRDRVLRGVTMAVVYVLLCGPSPRLTGISPEILAERLFKSARWDGLLRERRKRDKFGKS